MPKYKRLKIEKTEPPKPKGFDFGFYKNRTFRFGFGFSQKPTQTEPYTLILRQEQNKTYFASNFGLLYINLIFSLPKDSVFGGEHILPLEINKNYTYMSDIVIRVLQMVTTVPNKSI